MTSAMVQQLEVTDSAEAADATMRHVFNKMCEGKIAAGSVGVIKEQAKVHKDQAYIELGLA
eukprot:830540-Pyramimonas_sp.AAC.1